MVRGCHAPSQPLQNHPSKHLGGWTTPWSAEEVLDGHHQRVDIPAHVRTAHSGLLQKTLEEGAESSLMSPPTTLWVMGLNGTAFTRAVSLRLSPIRRCGTESGRACLPHGPYTSPEFSVQIFFSLKTTSRIRLTTALSFWWSVRNQQYQNQSTPLPTPSQ